MTREEFASVADEINTWAPMPLDEAATDRACADLSDLPVDVVRTVTHAWRLLNGETGTPSGADLRRLWAELALDAPPAEDAAPEIRQVFRRHREASGEHVGNQAALAELATRSPVFERVSRRFGGPPPHQADELRQSWAPLYRRCYDEERRRLLLRRVPATGLPGLARSARDGVVVDAAAA